VHVDEQDILLWEHDYFPSFCVLRISVGAEKEAVDVKLGNICKINGLFYFVCEIEACPKNRKYVIYTQKFTCF
jgi:hypothetical protein